MGQKIFKDDHYESKLQVYKNQVLLFRGRGYLTSHEFYGHLHAYCAETFIPLVNCFIILPLMIRM